MKSENCGGEMTSFFKKSHSWLEQGLQDPAAIDKIETAILLQDPENVAQINQAAPEKVHNLAMKLIRRGQEENRFDIFIKGYRLLQNAVLREQGQNNRAFSSFIKLYQDYGLENFAKGITPAIAPQFTFQRRHFEMGPVNAQTIAPEAKPSAPQLKC